MTISASVATFLMGASKSPCFTPFRRLAMRTAPSTRTAIMLLAVFLCFGNAAFACSQKICVEDPTCYGSWENCTTASGECASSAFTAACNGTYSLSAQVVCASGCHDCEACVIIDKVPSGTILATCRTICTNQDCNETCSVFLEAGVNYRMWVCKSPCDDTNCQECPSRCSAWGCLCVSPTPSPCAP